MKRTNIEVTGGEAGIDAHLPHGQRGPFFRHCVDRYLEELRGSLVMLRRKWGEAEVLEMLEADSLSARKQYETNLVHLAESERAAWAALAEGVEAVGVAPAALMALLESGVCA